MCVRCVYIHIYVSVVCVYVCAGVWCVRLVCVHMCALCVRACMRVRACACVLCVYVCVSYA